MNENPPTPRKFSRRLMLKLAAAAGVTAAAGDALLTYPPWLNYTGQERRTWDTPFQTEANAPTQMRELIRYATLAPSGHNAQPWKFSVIGNTIRITPDYSRRLPIVDPNDRELWISLGCALENMEIAARHAGFAAETSDPEPNADFIAVHLKQSPTQPYSGLFDAIPHRQNTRSHYDGRAVPPSEMQKVENVTPVSGVALRTITAADQKESVLEYVKSGNARQYANQAFLDELISWLRFNKPEALRTMDGLYTKCSGNPELPRWLGKRLITKSGVGRQSGADVQNVRSSSGLIVISSEGDDKRHWIAAGRLYERIALTLTALGVKTAFLNQPLEDASLRSQFQSYLKLGAAQPQLLLRFGYADAMPHSLRRPVSEVLAGM